MRLGIKPVNISRWRKHLIVCLCLGLLAVPIYFLDQALLKRGGGNWISLDFRGLFFGSYIGWFAIYVALSSLGLFFFPPSQKFGIQLGLMALSLILLVGGGIGYGKIRRWNYSNQHRALMKSRRALANVIELRDWRYLPDDISPEEIRATLAVHESGRFAGNAVGERSESESSWTTLFHSMNEQQRQVRRDDTFTYVLPLNRLHPGPADNVRLTFYLFKSPSGAGTGDIAKTFINSPYQEDDGQYFYGVLPPPSRP